MSFDQTRWTKLNQIVQNFFPKTVQIIAGSRFSSPPTYNRSSNQPKINKWFNLEIEDADIFRDDLKHWRNTEVSSAGSTTDPLVIETYLDLRNLSPQQIPILVENGKFWNCTKGGRKNEIVLERWIVEFVPYPSHSADKPGPDIPVIYKKAIILLRSLYAYTRLMPCWKLQRKLSKSKLTISPLSVGCRVLNGRQPISSRGRIGLTKNISDTSGPHLDSFAFHDIETPVGSIKVTVSYRSNCDFRVSDSESLLSTEFLDLDGKQDSHRDNKREYLSSSSKVPAEAPLSVYRPSSLRSGSSEGASLTKEGTPLPHQGLIPRNSPRSSDSPRTSVARATSPHSVTSQGRPSVSFVQPFKSPSLAESPSDINISPSTTSFTRISSNSSVAALRIPANQPTQTRRDSGPSIPDYAISSSASSSSTRGDSSLRRYSSSFVQRGQWPRSGSVGSAHSRSRRQSLVGEPSSLESNTSLSMEPGSGMYVPNQDLGDFVKLVDYSTGLFDPGRRSQSLSSSGGDNSNSRGPSLSPIFSGINEKDGSPVSRDSPGNSKNPLSRFQQLRTSHNILTESLQSSLYVSRPDSGVSGTPPHVSGSPYTRSSYSGGVGSLGGTSAASAHTPVIPSRLSEAVSVGEEGTRSSSRGVNIERTPSGANETISSSARVDPVDITSSSQHRLGSAYRSRRKSSSLSSQRTYDDPDETEPNAPTTAPAYSRMSRPPSQHRSSVGSRTRSRSRLSISGRNKYQDDDLGREEEDDDLLFAMSDMHLVRGALESERNNPFDDWKEGH